MMRAGLPTAVAPAGTGLVTTASHPAAIARRRSQACRQSFFDGTVEVLLQEERAFVGTADTRDTTQLSLAVTKRDERGHERADCGAMLGGESGPDISLEVCTADVAGSHRLQVKAFSRCAELVGSPPGQRRLARGIEHEVGRFQVRSQGGYSPLCDADCGKTAAAREINRAR